MRPEDTKHATNSSAWAIGREHKGKFYVRRVVLGLLIASYEVRDGEQIRACHIMVEKKFKPRPNLQIK